MSNTITIPAIPSDWIRHTGIMPADGFTRTRVDRVLHRAEGYMPFVIHRAYVYEGKWAYECGSYFLTEQEALNAF
jgi:uncharacterized membrane protein YjdF